MWCERGENGSTETAIISVVFPLMPLMPIKFCFSALFSAIGRISLKAAKCFVGVDSLLREQTPEGGSGGET